METIVVLLLAWYSPISAVDMYDPVGQGYWPDLTYSIDDNLDTYATEAFAPALRPAQYFFGKTSVVRIYLEEPHEVIVEFPHGDLWYELYSGIIDEKIDLDSTYPIESITICSLEPNKQLKISEVYVPEPATILFVAMGIIVLKLKKQLDCGKNNTTINKAAAKNNP